ncbi:MAG: right-handed parallel beta-helix repeat-containing protein, partial [Pseudomonadota bacterium]
GGVPPGDPGGVVTPGPTPSPIDPAVPNPGDPTDPIDPGPGVSTGPRVYLVSADHADASDDNDGASLPFATLQRGLDALSPGDTLLVDGASEPYRQVDAIDGRTVAGFVLSTSGTAEAPITIIGSATRPVIDQGQTSASAGTPVLGLLLDCVSHVTVRNLEVRNVNDAGISTSLTGCDTSGLRIEANHIHHVFGHDAVGAVRLANASQVSVGTNQIHDVYRTPGGPTTALVVGSPSSGIVVQNNSIREAEAGVTVRSAGQLIESADITGNRIADVDTGVYVTSDRGSGGAVQGVQVADNVMLRLARAFDASVDVSGAVTGDARVYNNTAVDVSDALVRTSGIDGLEVYNNVAVRLTGDALVTLAPRASAHANSIVFHDHNVLWDSSGPNWTLDLGGPNAQRFSGFDGWRAAWSGSGHSDLMLDPDLSSRWADPQFADEASEDYTTTNPALSGAGRNGGAVGARRNSR